jgi:DNA-binding SARP family transcriptional activator
MTTQPALRICLFGEFSVTYGDEPIPALALTRLQHLLAYIVLHRHAPISREQLAYLFWPESSEAGARTNLRGVLYRLRAALPNSDLYLRLDMTTVQWNERSPYHLDVAEFEAALGAAGLAEREGRRADMRAALERAAALYHGQLLPTCYLDWIEPLRDRLSHTFVEALEKLIALLEAQRDYATALEHAMRLLEQDTLREATYRLLMRLHALNDDRASALRMYHACQAILRRELDIEPGAATRELHDQLLKAENAAHAAKQDAALPGVPMIGRTTEWEALQGAWLAAVRGSPYCAVLLGEAGIGKTRLAEEMMQWARLQGMTHALARCYASGESVAYVPVVDWLRAPALRASVTSANGAVRREVARLLPEIEPGDLLEAEPLPVAQQRQRLFDALATTVLRAPQPTVLVLDDAQWCDRETIEWLRYLLHWPQRSRLLLLVTARVEELHDAHPLCELMRDLQRTRQITEIDLKPLGAMETATLAERLAGRMLTQQQADTLYRETEGNPLFVVEVVQNTLDAPGAPHGLDHMPVLQRGRSPTVQAVIARRLAQLSPSARELACMAATIGRKFAVPVLQRASNRDAELLARDLDELWRRRIIRAAPSENDAALDVYDFTHDKIREAAYVSSGPVKRRWLHLQVAQALEGAGAGIGVGVGVGAGDADSVSAQVASQYAQAGMPERAIPHLVRTAEVARRVFANDAALGLCARALDMLASMPDTPENARLELDVLLARMAPLIASQGYASDAVGQARRRAWELGQRVARSDELIELTGELWNFHHVKSEWFQARAYGQAFLEQAIRSGDQAWILEAHRCVDETALMTGQLAATRTYAHWERISYDPYRRSLMLDGAEIAAKDPVAMLAFCARVLWANGDIDRAVASTDRMLALAEDLRDPYQITFALSTATQIKLFVGRCEDCRAQVDRLIQIGSQRGFAFMLAGGIFFRGWLMTTLDGQTAEGIALIRDGIAQWRKTGAGLWSPYMLGMLAEAHLRAGQSADGLAVVSEALTIINDTGECFWEPELRRLQGELMRASVPASEATPHVMQEIERCFRAALDAAQQQQLRPLALRAAVSLAHLLQTQGHNVAAGRVLNDAYGSLREGFNTPDMAEAKTMLDRLAGSGATKRRRTRHAVGLRRRT